MNKPIDFWKRDLFSEERKFDIFDSDVGELEIDEGTMIAKGYVNILLGNLKKCSQITDPKLVFVSTR